MVFVFGRVIYGCLVGNFVPVVTVDSCGTTMGVVFMAMFYKYSPNRAYVMKLWLALACAQIVVVVWVSLALTDVIHQSRRQVEIILGFINAGIDIVMYSSPLATLVHVVRTKDATSIPLTMSVVSLFNTMLWVAVSTDDLFLAIPNGLGCGFSLIGIIAFFIYRPGKFQPPSEAHTPETDSHLQEIRLDATDKADFVELPSPVVVIASAKQ